MTVSELLLKLGGAFALFRPAGEAWAPVFRARLGRHEGPALQQAFLDTLATFRPSPRQAFPLPADFEPCRTMKPPRGGEDTPRLDFAARARRAERLMAEWRREQGALPPRGDSHGDAWWGQIAAIALRWNLDTRREQWRGASSLSTKENP